MSKSDEYKMHMKQNETFNLAIDIIILLLHMLGFHKAEI